MEGKLSDFDNKTNLITFKKFTTSQVLDIIMKIWYNTEDSKTIIIVLC